MTLSKQKQAERAFHILIDKYENPEGKEFFCFPVCPLCKIYYTNMNENYICEGCPLASSGGNVGCRMFKSYKNAHRALYRLNYFTEVKTFPFKDGIPQERMERFNNAKEAFALRAEFFKKALPIIQSWPPKRFTRQGWKYSGKDLPREW